MRSNVEDDSTNDYGAYIEQLRSPDPDVFAAAFEALRQDIQVIKIRVFQTMRTESDIQAKGALIELLGESEDPRFISHIAKIFSSDRTQRHFWAFTALQRIGMSKDLNASDKRRVHCILSNVKRTWKTQS